MKKIISLILIICVVGILFGCNEQSETSSLVTSSEPDPIEEPIKTQSGIENKVRALGRTVISNDGIWATWSGSGVEFSFTGTGVSADVRASLVFGNGNEMLMGVFVDGEVAPRKTVTVSSKKQTAVLCEGLKDTSHTLKFIKLTEAQYGSVCIENITANGMQPTTPKELTFEFIGDSVICGNGIRSKSPRGDFTTVQQDVSLTMGYLLSQEYGADSRYIAATGYGVDQSSSSGKMIEGIYTKTSPFLRDQTGLDAGDWNFSDPADMVFINIGSDRADYITDEAGRAAFTGELVNFVKTVRQKNPNAEIFLLCGTATYDLKEQIRNAYSGLKDDEKLHFFSFSFESQLVYSGIAAGYPSAHSNNRMLKEIKKELKKLGFEPKK